MKSIERGQSHKNILDVTYFFVLVYFLWWGMEAIINGVTTDFQSNCFSLAALLVLGLASQVGLNIVPGLILCKLKKLDIKRIFKVNHISMKLFFLSLILFLSFNGTALFADNFIDIIAGWFGLGYKRKRTF